MKVDKEKMVDKWIKSWKHVESPKRIMQIDIRMLRSLYGKRINVRHVIK